jgi:hypothetical protein
VVEGEARGALHVVVSSTAKRVVGTDNDLLAATRQLHRCKLLFIVLLEGGRELRGEARIGDCEGFDICASFVRGLSRVLLAGERCINTG